MQNEPDKLRSFQVSEFRDTYRRLLLTAIAKGPVLEIYDLSDPNRFPIEWESVDEENRHALKLAFERLIKQRPVEPEELALHLTPVHDEIALQLEKQIVHRQHHHECTKNPTVSEEERIALCELLGKLATEFPGCCVSIFDSYTKASTDSNTRIRSVAVIWEGFATLSWPRRFSVLKAFAAEHTFVLVGMTPEECKGNAFPGISSRINKQYQIDTSKFASGSGWRDSR
jgi:hypothetical protein